MSKNICVLFGGSSLTGYTYSLIRQVFHPLSPEDISFINLTEKQIGFFDYQNKHTSDEFLPCIHSLLEYKLIVIASPVYWYSVSAQTKIFLDRLTDLLYFEKIFLPKLQEKTFAFISTYSTSPGYALPIISETLNYLKLPLLCSLMLKNDNLHDASIEIFRQQCMNFIGYNEHNTNDTANDTDVIL